MEWFPNDFQRIAKLKREIKKKMYDKNKGCGNWLIKWSAAYKKREILEHA